MKSIFLLDMDDTLLDFPKAEREGIIITFKKLGLSSDDGVVSRFHAVNDMLWKALERGETTRERIVYERFEILFNELGVKENARAAADIYFETLANVCYPFEGVEVFLKELKKRGCIYIPTNGSCIIQRRHLTDANILPYCDGVFISEEIGVYKPSAQYAAFVAAHIPDFKRENAVYLGDSPTADKVTAERMGIDFVRYFPRGKGSGDEGVASYTEFLAWVDSH